MTTKSIIVTGTGTQTVCATMPPVMTLVDSRAICAFNFNADTQVLTVVYREKNKKGENAVYQFFGITCDLFEEIFSSKSIGKALGDKVTRSKEVTFPYWKVHNYTS